MQAYTGVNNEDMLIEKAFSEFLEGKIDEYTLSIKLAKIGTKIIGKPVDVTVGKLDYSDIFVNINLTLEAGNKLRLNVLGIYIDSDFIQGFKPNELTAIFLFELGVYEYVLNNPDLRKWILLSYSNGIVAPITFVLSSGLSAVKKVDNWYSTLGMIALVSIFTSFLISLISQYKVNDLIPNSIQYVVKYNRLSDYKAFMKKYKRYYTLYLFGLEKYIPLKSAIKDVVMSLKRFRDLIIYSQDEESGIVCEVYKSLLLNKQKYSVTNEVLEDAIKTFKEMCNKPNLTDVLKGRIFKLQKSIQDAILSLANKSLEV